MQVPALERWTNLETLVLDWCDLLNHLTLSMPRLKKISLRHCKMLTSVRVFTHLHMHSEQAVDYLCGVRLSLYQNIFQRVSLSHGVLTRFP